MNKISRFALLSVIGICFYSNQSFAMRRSLFNPKHSTFLTTKSQLSSRNWFCTNPESTKQILCANCSKLNKNSSLGKKIILGTLGVGLAVPSLILVGGGLVKYGFFWCKKIDKFYDNVEEGYQKLKERYKNN